eukprot:Opistho-2@35795
MLATLPPHRAMAEEGVTRTSVTTLPAYAKVDSTAKFCEDGEAQLYAIASTVAEELKSVDFDALSYTNTELAVLLEIMIDHGLGLVESLKMNRTKLRSFLRVMQTNYNDDEHVPYHCWRHAFYVSQMMYTIVFNCNLRRTFTDLDLLTLMLSCIAHDVGHMGLNNAYHKSAQTDLFTKYPVSTLESFHVDITLGVLSKSEYDVLDFLAPTEHQAVADHIVRNILTTDMAMHFDKMKEVEKMHAEGRTLNDRNCQMLVMELLVKACDVSNEARTPDVCDKWAERLNDEFFKQGDRELAEGLQVTPRMDRRTVSKAAAQTFFIRMFSLPLYEAIGVSFPSFSEIYVPRLRTVYEFYVKMEEADKLAASLKPSAT